MGSKALTSGEKAVKNIEQNRNNRLSKAGGLGVEAASAVAVLAGLSETERLRAVHMLGFAQVRRIWTPRVPGAVPTLDEVVPQRDRELIVGSSEWEARYRRATTVIVYVLQCLGLCNLSTFLGGVSLAKLGMTEETNLPRRLVDLASSGYGGWIRGRRSYERLPGFDLFRPAPRLQVAPQHPGSPVSLCAHGIRVDLPEGMSPAAFEGRLNAALLPIRLQTLAGSETVLELCAHRGIDPHLLQRFDRRGRTYRSATEIAHFRPQADAAALAAVCTDIVIDTVLDRLPVRPR